MSRSSLGLLALLSLAIYSSSYGHESTQGRVYFLDSCTKDVTATVASQGVTLVAEIKNLDLDIPVQVDLTFGPQQANEKSRFFSVRKELKPHSYHLSPSTGYIKVKKHLEIKGNPDDGDSASARIWTVTLRWRQKTKTGELKVGHQQASVYVMKNDQEKFYEATDVPMLSWSSPVEIVSDYKFNPSKGLLSFSKTVSLKNSIGRSGEFDLGFSPMTNSPRGTGPFVNSTLAYNAWFFSGWKSAKREDYETSTVRTWSVAQEQGGFFGERVTFMRVPAREHVFRPGHGFFSCGTWEISRKGYLDIGHTELDFYLVPKSMSTDLDASKRFMNPPGEYTEALNYDLQVSGTGEDLMFFNPE